ncbi:MAG TPA: universal stress protein [Planctomycetes bacterium]|nr:universal stress protein [Planctomycetota bacterium]HIK61249.1 universal stress protein [Planctomycetota bacterium]
MRELQTILVGLQVAFPEGALTLGSDRALDQALWVAQTAGAELHLVHSTHGQAESDAASASALGAGDAPGLVEAVERCSAHGLKVTSEVTDLRPWRALVLLAVQGRGQMVVLGKRDSPTAEGRRLGAVAVKVLRKCPVPVWAVRPEHDQNHKLVLAATDLSEVGGQALDLAAWVAEHQGARLHVVHALSNPEGYGASEGEEREALLDKQKACAGALVDERISSGPFDGESAVHLSRRQPYLAIREAGEHLHPDLLVMGSLTTEGEPGLLVGGTAERLLGRTNCSLLMLKPQGYVCPVTP